MLNRFTVRSIDSSLASFVFIAYSVLFILLFIALDEKQKCAAGCYDFILLSEIY